MQMKKKNPNITKHFKIEMHCKAQGDRTQTAECEAQPPKWKILQCNTSQNMKHKHQSAKCFNIAKSASMKREH